MTNRPPSAGCLGTRPEKTLLSKATHYSEHCPWYTESDHRLEDASLYFLTRQEDLPVSSSPFHILGTQPCKLLWVRDCALLSFLFPVLSTNLGTEQTFNTDLLNSIIPQIFELLLWARCCSRHLYPRTKMGKSSDFSEFGSGRESI